MRTKWMAAVLGLAGIVVATCDRAAGSQDTRVSNLLAQSRAALGASALNRVRVVEQHAKVSTAGLPGTAVSWNEIGGLRFAELVSTLPVVSGDGYDGTDVWGSDGSGLVWVDGGTAGRAQEISQAFATNYALWAPHSAGATVRWLGTRSANGAAFDAIEVLAPGSEVPFEFWFDRTTHLPARVVQTVGTVTATTIFSKYRPVSGLKLPFAVHSETSDGNSSDVSIENAIVNPAGGSGHLRKPLSNVHDFSIRGGSSTTIPFELSENHVYISLLLDGKGPYSFVFDTGGQNVVDPQVAKEIGAAGKGSVQAGGVGAQTESFSFANVSDVQLGDANVRNQLFFVAPTRTGFGVSTGRRVDGIIGFEVLSRFITTFDYPNNRVTLQMPGAQTAAGSVIRFVLNGRQPQFSCGIDSIAAQCTLDTGARDSITISTPFAAAHPSIVPQTLTAPGVSGFGVGGPSLGRLGRLRSLQMGQFTLPNVVADFSTQKQGAFAQPFVAANVGGNLLKRFALTLDYAAQEMMLSPGPGYQTPDAYERSGLFLIQHDGKYVVFDVRAGTPAAAAGILKGDAIDSIDGKSVAAMTLQDVRTFFSGAPGTQVRVTVTGADKKPRETTITLQDYV